MYIAQDKNTIEQLTDVDTILQSWEIFCRHFSCKPDKKEFPKYNPGDIIDEEKSVKWNREEVERRMTARAEEGKRLRALYNELNGLYEEAMIKALAKEYKISEKEVGIIWAKAYEDDHPFGMMSVYDKFCELAEMYEELRKVANEA